MGISYAPKILLDEVEDAGDQKRRGVLRVQRQGGGSRKVSRKVGTGVWGLGNCRFRRVGRIYTGIEEGGGEHSRN